MMHFTQKKHGEKKPNIVYEYTVSSSKHYLKYWRMLQSAMNLHLICHTLDHTSFVHCFFVNLQKGTTIERDNYTPAIHTINM